MEQSELLKYAVDKIETLRIPYFITGSIASIAYGEPRLTNDIDIIIDIKESDVKAFKGLFPETDFYITEEDIREAIYNRRQFNILHPSSGLKIDIIIGKHDLFDEGRFKRIRRIEIAENTTANFSSPEDVIIKKMEFYKEGGSEKHLRDITGILKISGDILDTGYINKWVNKLELNDIWESVTKAK